MGSRLPQHSTATRSPELQGSVHCLIAPHAIVCIICSRPLNNCLNPMHFNSPSGSLVTLDLGLAGPIDAGMHLRMRVQWTYFRRSVVPLRLEVCSGAGA